MKINTPREMGIYYVNGDKIESVEKINYWESRIEEDVDNRINKSLVAYHVLNKYLEIE